MKIIFANGLEKDMITVYGGHKTVQGANRDMLSFVFDGGSDLNELDGVFTEEACESIKTIDDNGAEHFHKWYTVRVSIEKKEVVVQTETPESEAVVESRVIVSMAQRTYQENKMKELEEKMNALLNA
jgi:hypothetical protein